MRSAWLLVVVACGGEPATIEAPHPPPMPLDASTTDAIELDASAADADAMLLEAPADASDGGPRFVGGLRELEVRRIVMAHNALFTACFGMVAQGRPELRGRAHFSWLIDSSGSVGFARLDDTTLNDARVEGCVLRQLRALRFPSAPSSTQVLGFPMTFRTTD